jgi:hypothetical protein
MGPFRKRTRPCGLSQIIKRGRPERARHTPCARGGLNPNLITQKAAARSLPVAPHVLGIAPPRAVRARLGVRLGGLLAAIPPEEARLVAEAVEQHAEEVIGRGPVRAKRLDDRVAPGGDVGVEVLIDERAGGKAPADAPEARSRGRTRRTGAQCP